MRSTSPLFRLASLSLLLLASSASAQGLYRSVDSLGRVTFSDRPPASGQVTSTRSGSVDASEPTGSGLPYALRQAMERYPVTLYSQDDCAPCAEGRALLQSRGIPFSERTVNTPQDSLALERLSGQGSLPLLTIGTQQVKGFSDTEWARYLDAAGYPASIKLPASYRPAAVRPLAPPTAQAAPASRADTSGTPATADAAAPANGEAPRTRRTVPTPSIDIPANNPAGIRF